MSAPNHHCLDKQWEDDLCPTSRLIQRLFTDYWALGDWNTQTTYLQIQTTKVPVKRRSTHSEDNMQVFVRLNHVIVEGTGITVCKDVFASIHCVSK